MPGLERIARALESDADALARNPWQEVSPFALRGVRVDRSGEQWVVRDADDVVLPISGRFTGGWKMMAIAGGAAVDVFGEWDGEVLTPLGIWAASRHHALIPREVSDAA